MVNAVTTPAPELLDARAVATMLDISVAGFYRLSAAGKIPKPVRLMRSVRWRRNEVCEWIKAGCPSSRRVTENHYLDPTIVAGSHASEVLFRP